jgi:hypothetical protein
MEKPGKPGVESRFFKDGPYTRVFTTIFRFTFDTEHLYTKRVDVYLYFLGFYTSIYLFVFRKNSDIQHCQRWAFGVEQQSKNKNTVLPHKHCVYAEYCMGIYLFLFHLFSG